MFQRLSGKTAVVTGGSRGIGAAIARKLAGEGASVVLSYRSRSDAAAQVVADIAAANGRAAAVQADVPDVGAIVALFDRAVALYGRVDILVNNAASGAARPLLDVDEAHVDALLAVNLRGALFASREAARRFGEGSGRIVNISSLNGRTPTPGGSVYAATKAALESFTRSHAAELGPRGVTVNAVAPGFTNTEMLAAALPREMWPEAAKHTALGRIGQPEDIAEVVAFLASDAGRWVTGQVIGADGGVLAW